MSRVHWLLTIRSGTMAFKVILLAAMLQLAACKPTLTLEDMEVADDVVAVGSYVREVRAAAPQDYHKSYQNEGDGEIGYSRKKQGGGKKGYQHFDSYHKKAGDNYEFEKQDSFGQDDGGNHGAYSHNHERKEKGDKPHGDTNDRGVNYGGNNKIRRLGANGDGGKENDIQDSYSNQSGKVALENGYRDIRDVDTKDYRSIDSQGADTQQYEIVGDNDNGYDRNYDYDVNDDIEADDAEGRSAKIRRPRPWRFIRRLVRWFF